MADAKSYAYIEVVFDNEAKEYFSNLVKEIVPEKSLYYSTDEGYSHINGDVTEKLHCTLFFGIDPATIQDQKLLDIIENSDFSDIKLGKLVLFNGWQNQYKILCIEVEDDGRFTKFAKEVQDFVNDEKITYEVKPHMSLAYVQPDYELPEQQIELKDSLRSEKVKISIFEG